MWNKIYPRTYASDLLPNANNIIKTCVFEHNLTVQFIHRMLGWGLCMIIPGFWRYSREFELTPQQNFAITALMNIIIVQFILGILTLFWVVPVWLGVLHQAGAVLLLAVWVISYFLINNVAKNT